MDNRKEIIDVFTKKLTSLGFTSLNIRNYKINFAITNKGQSTEDTWKTFLVVIEFTTAHYTISVIFNYNNKVYSFKGPMKLLVLEAMQLINKKSSTTTFKMNQTKGRISLKQLTLYSLVPTTWWEQLVDDSIRNSLTMYKHFACAFVRIITGATDLPALLKECIKRSNGKISEITSDNDSDDDSSNSSSQNKPTETLLELLSTQELLSRILEVGETQETSKVSALDYLKDSKNYSKFMEMLEKIYYAGVELVDLKLKKLFIKEDDTAIRKIFINKFKYLSEVYEKTQENFYKYSNDLLINLNKDLAESYKVDSMNIIKKNQVHIIDRSHLQLFDIRSNENIIGTGGFGVIYRNFLFDIPVAIKFPKVDALNGRQISKLISEHKILQSLDHENIIKTFGFVDVNGKFGIVMELCLAGGLNTVIRSNVSMKMKQKLSIMLKVLKAIEYLHMKGIVHFDIKPHNILLDNNMNPKIADFGLCQRSTEKGLKKTGYTLTFASPEQIKGHNMSPKVDVWSFGMTLYYVITGIGPYDYLNQGNKRKLEKNLFYNEIYNKKRTPKIPENIEIEYPQLTKLIRETWKTDPEARPSSKMVRIRLTEIYNNMA